jgi:ferredoxin-NADP reductase
MTTRIVARCLLCDSLHAQQEFRASTMPNHTWPSYRTFLVQSIVHESDTAKSFYLIPADGGGLTPYHPGQHLPLRLAIPGHPRPMIRCYTLSDCFRERYYRLTVKRESAAPHLPDVPAGVSSNYLHDHIRVGDAIEATMPSGSFYLDMEQYHAVAMIAGGIGVTPMISMLNAIARTKVSRNIYFFFAVRHGGDHVFKEHLQELQKTCPNIHLQVFYDEPRPHDRHGFDFDHAGRVDTEVLRQVLPSLQMEYYVCGPPGMMHAISEGLRGAGVSAESIRTESFGPSSLSYRNALRMDEASTESLEVKFLRSGVTAQWTSADGTLLELAEKHGVNIDFGCRYGDCATCLTSLVRGKVAYLHPTGAEPEPGSCLPCSCRPETAVDLDA